MTPSTDQLYDLLPAVHRMRDAERGYPLRALLAVIGEQAQLVEDDITRLYDNWFIETCEDWIVPYIGDLIGYRPVSEAGSGSAVVPGARRIVAPRREVATTLGLRRRKGTLALLEVLADSTARWPARAVELYRLLGWTQHLRHLRLDRGRTADLRDVDALDLLDGPFERIAHTVDVRLPSSHRTRGRYDVPSVGLFVWPLNVYSITRAPASCVEDDGPQCFTFNVLGHDTRLYTRIERETEPTHIAEEINVPAPIRRRAFEQRLTSHPLTAQASSAYYGDGKSITIWAPDWPRRPSQSTGAPIPAELIVPADLSDWRYRAPRGKVGVDPVLGRMVFPAGQLPKRGVWVSYQYGFSADMGGGEYDRPLSQPLAFTLYRVRQDQRGPGIHETINAALDQWRADQHALGPEPADTDPAKPDWVARNDRLRAAVIEIQDSGSYSERLTISLHAGESLQLRAANRTRPVLHMLDYMSARPDAFMIVGERGSRFTLDGIVVTGRGLQVSGPDPSDTESAARGDLCDVTLRHVTLVPGWGVDCDCEPKRPNEPSLELINTAATVTIEHSILGSIDVVADEVTTDPIAIRISDSIVDATSEERVAIGAPTGPFAFARLTVARTTVIGEVGVHSLPLAEDTIFMGAARVARRQIGCLRFCYLTPVSRTPRAYHCQPALAIATAAEDARNNGDTSMSTDPLDPTRARCASGACDAGESARVRPRFLSTRYGSPVYCRLAEDCAVEITAGASDESEMGAFHDLYQPQREANLRIRADEYTPAGLTTGLLTAPLRMDR